MRGIKFGDKRLPPRFWAKVEPDPATGCWMWTAATNSSGYGHFSWRGKSDGAHRVLYLVLIGEVAPSRHVGHNCHDRDTACPGGRGCRHRRCVNPDHLAEMTHAENQAASPLTWTSQGKVRTHCKRNHEFTPENTITGAKGRECRTCAYARITAYEQTEAGRVTRSKIKAKVKASRPAPAPRTRCRNNHEYTPENTYEGYGYRSCRTCMRDRERRHKSS